MSFSQVFEILRARWLTLVVTLGVVMALVMLVNAIMPRQYTATASVLIDSKSADPINGATTPYVMIPGYLATQIDIISSERVAQKVVRDLKLNENPQLQAQWRSAMDGAGSFDSWLSEIILKNLDIKPARESSVINVGYAGAEPQFAAAVANAFVRGYIETTLELRVEPAKQFGKLFDDQVKQSRERVEQAQAKLNAYQQSHNLFTSDERLDVEISRLNELSAQVVGLQTQTADSVSRAAHGGINSPDVVANIVVSGIKTEIIRQEAKLNEISSKFGNSNPQVIELKDNIATLKNQLASEARGVNASVGINSTTSLQREERVRQAMEAQRQKVIKFKQQRDEAAVLGRDVENAQKIYENLLSRLSQNSLESQTNQTNVSILKNASPPVSPSSPKIILNLFLGFLVGTALGVMIALSKEMTGRKLRTAEDVVTGLGVPVMGFMPLAEGREKNSSAAMKKLSIGGKLRLPFSSPANS